MKKFLIKNHSKIKFPDTIEEGDSLEYRLFDGKVEYVSPDGIVYLLKANPFEICVFNELINTNTSKNMILASWAIMDLIWIDMEDLENVFLIGITLK